MGKFYFRIADNPGVGPLNDDKRIFSVPIDEPITSGFPVICPESMPSAEITCYLTSGPGINLANFLEPVSGQLADGEWDSAGSSVSRNTSWDEFIAFKAYLDYRQ